MKNLKVLAIVSAIDLEEAPRGTIFWWQLFKNMSELGVEVIVVSFLGKSIVTPWWECYPNPAYYTAKLAYGTVKNSQKNYTIKSIKSFAEKIKIDIAIGRIISEQWEKTISEIAVKEKNIDAVLLLSLPIKPLEPLIRQIKKKIGKKIVYIEADMPEVLPEYNMFGYSYYANTDLSIFDGYLSNSEGVSQTVKKMGASNVGTLHFAIDPEIYKIYPEEKIIDIIFSGVGTGGRRELINKMIIKPAIDSSLKFGVSGIWKIALPENVTQLGFVPFARWLRVICSSYIALDVVRHGHAAVRETSTYRLFELCGLGLPVVTNKRDGIERFYQPGKEIIMLNDNDNPLQVYQKLLEDKEKLIKISRLARERTLKEHTCRHRALELIEYLRRIK